MDKKEAKNKILAHVLKKYPCIVATNCVVEMVIDEYEKLLNEPDDERWRAEYTARQASGERFDYRISIQSNIWYSGDHWKFDKPCVKGQFRLHVEPVDKIPHASERALYWKQRAEGTNEDWQYSNLRQDGWVDVMGEPAWMPHNKYRPKPKTRTVYFALAKYEGGRFGSWSRECKDRLVKDIEHSGAIIIGDIETREIECD